MCQGAVDAVVGHEVFGRADLGFQVPAYPVDCVAVGGLLCSLSVSSSVTLELSCLGVPGPAQSAPRHGAGRHGALRGASQLPAMTRCGRCILLVDTFCC